MPFDSAESVFTTCSRMLGSHLYALPDGETGERSTWIMCLPNLAYRNNPAIEPIVFVPPELVRSPQSKDPDQMRATFSHFRLKPGVQELTLNPPYAREAMASYRALCRLREAGRVPCDIPFQVSLPCTHDAVSSFFPDAKDRPIAARAYERAIRTMMQDMLAHIPAHDLVVQWDYCTELLAIIGKKGDVPSEERFVRFTARDYLAPMLDPIPEAVRVGYHLCYGTWGGWPIGDVRDIGFCVRLANAMVANSSRRIDFVHLPVMPGADDAFFRPLASLAVGEAKVFLGLELSDGADAMVQRAALARRYLPEFGVSH